MIIKEVATNQSIIDHYSELIAQTKIDDQSKLNIYISPQLITALGKEK